MKARKLFFVTIALFFLGGTLFTEAKAFKKTACDFTVPDDGTFNEAIEAANNREDKDTRFVIFVRKGRYHIGTPDKPITTLHAPKTTIRGEGMDCTQLYNTPRHEGIGSTSTLYVYQSDSTVIEDIELWCNYPYDPNAFANRAVALQERNCKGNRLMRVSLRSTQDTYYTNGGGTTYLEDCRIFGTVDFICGGGTVVFNGCRLILMPRGVPGQRDIIVAPATERDREVGYVFVHCSIEGPEEQAGLYRLGRAWRNEPKALFVDTRFEIAPSDTLWDVMKDCHWNYHEIIE